MNVKKDISNIQEDNAIIVEMKLVIVINAIMAKCLNAIIV